MTDDVHDRLERLHEQLAATAQRSVDPDTAAWLGEAEAVVADVATDPTAPEEAVQLRIEQATRLLANVDRTGDSIADEHVAAARELLAELTANGDDRE